MVNILLIEDDEVDVMNIRRAFKKNGIVNPLYVAGNGLEALEMLRKEEIKPLPKIILLDINMPRMNGIEFLNELRNEEKFDYIHVFVMTSSKSDQDRIDALNLDVSGYFIKPLSFEEFVASAPLVNSYWQITEISE